MTNSIDVERWSRADQDGATQLWRELMQPQPADSLKREARNLLASAPPFRVCLHVLRLFPDYLTTEAEPLLHDFLSAHAAELDGDALHELGTIFVELWRRAPRDSCWYGDLRQQFVPEALQERLATIPGVAAQLVEDFAILTREQRARPTELGCRRLERAGELLLHAPPEGCRELMVPMIELDRLDRQHTRPLHWRYEKVYWAMTRIVRKLGADL